MTVKIDTDARIAKIRVQEQVSDPSAPSTGYGWVYEKDDQQLYLGNASGTASNIYHYGTAFPGSPKTRELFYRTDRDLMYFYDGTRWLTTQIFLIELKQEDSGITWALTATTVPVHRGTLPFGGDYDYYLLEWQFSSSVLTTNDGTKYWTANLNKYNSTGGGDTNIATANTSADTANNVYNKKVTINALLGSYVGFYTDAAKTSTPGNFRFFGGHITCRAVG